MSDGWADPLKQEENKIEVVVEGKETPKSEPEKPIPKKVEAEDGFENLSERVQKRINKLTRERKEAIERATTLEQQATQKVQQLQQELETARKQTTKAVATGVSNYEAQLKDKLVLAQQAFEDAYDSGDKKKLSAAQLAISEATAELKLLGIKKAETPEEPEEKKASPQPQPRQQQQQFSPKAVAWAEKHKDWFGKDKGATSFTLGIDQDLQEEGWDPNSDEYYEEVDRRLHKRFPEYFEESEEETPQPQKKKPVTPVVSGGSRTPGTQKVRLTQSELTTARKLGVTPEAYAAQKLKTEAAGDGEYTLI